MLALQTLFCHSVEDSVELLNVGVKDDISTRYALHY